MAYIFNRTCISYYIFYIVCIYIYILCLFCILYLYIKTEREREFLVHSKHPVHGRYHYRYYNSKDESPDLWETQPSTWCSAWALFALKTCLERRVCVIPTLTQGLVWPNLAIEKEKGELPKGETHIVWSSFLVSPQFLDITLRLGYWSSSWICANPSALLHSGTLVTEERPSPAAPHCCPGCGS